MNVSTLVLCVLVSWIYQKPEQEHNLSQIDSTTIEVILNDIFSSPESTNLSDYGKYSIDSILTIYKFNDCKEIDIYCFWPDKEESSSIRSIKKAESVAEYLIEKNVSPDKIKSIGLGISKDENFSIQSKSTTLVLVY